MSATVVAVFFASVFGMIMGAFWESERAYRASLRAQAERERKLAPTHPCLRLVQ